MSCIEHLIDIANIVSAVDKDGIIKVYGDRKNVFAVAKNGKIDPTDLVAFRLSGQEIDKQADIVCYFKSKALVPELINETVGLANLELFARMAKLHPNSARTLNYDEGKPAEIRFDSGDGFVSYYRLTSGAITSENVRVPAFIGKPCDISFLLGEKTINLFKKNASEASIANKKYFWPMMNSRGYLYFSFDRDAPSNMTDRFEMARGLPHVELAPYSYKASSLKGILSRTSNCDSVTIGISNQGFMEVNVNNKFGCYRFILIGSEHKIWQWDWTNKWHQVLNIETLIQDDVCMHCDWEPPL